MIFDPIRDAAVASQPHRCKWLLAACVLLGIGLPAAQYSLSFHPAFRPYVWRLNSKPVGWINWLLATELITGLVLLTLASLYPGRHSAPLPCIAIVPPKSKWKSKWIQLARITGVCVAFAILALCLGFSSRFEGDYTGWIKIAHRPDLFASEALGRWSHYAAYKLLQLIGYASNDLALRVSSVIAGCLLLAGIQLLAPSAFPHTSTSLAILIVFTSPLVALFCGYRETTPFAYAFAGIYLLLCLRYINRNLSRFPWLETIVLSLAIWSHGAICFWSAAHLVLAAIWFSRCYNAESLAPAAAAKLLFLCVVPFAPMALTMLGAYYLGTTGNWFGNALGGGDLVMFVDFTGHPAGPQFTIWSRTYWLNSLNLLVYACPLLPVAVCAAASKIRSEPKSVALLAAALTGALVLGLFWNPDIGYAKDFDLLAGFTIPAHLLLLLWLQHCPRRMQLAFALPYALANITIHVFPFAEAL